jgi:hypothetical protein
MKSRLMFWIAFSFFAVTGAFAQRPGGHGMGGTQQRGGMQQGNTMGAQAQDHQRTKERLHVTTQQEQQVTNCIRSAERIRTRTRQMAKLANGKKFNATDAQRIREELRAEIQAMNEQQEQFMAGLSDDQKAAAQKPAEEAKRSSEDLKSMSDSLDLALEEEELQASEKLRQQIRNLDETAKQLLNHQREIAETLGIQP